MACAAVVLAQLAKNQNKGSIIFKTLLSFLSFLFFFFAPFSLYGKSHVLFKVGRVLRRFLSPAGLEVLHSVIINDPFTPIRMSQVINFGI